MIKNKKPKIVIVGGPTASGKSFFAVRLALAFNAEIVGADSMQIYKRMNIGTGKITDKEMSGIRHRLIDIVEPNASYSVGQYCLDAAKAIDEVLIQNKLPIIVGGTGLYINSLINGYSFFNTIRNEEFRQGLHKKAEELGTEYLYNKLKAIDPISAQKIGAGDLKRIIRALEICEFSDKNKSEMMDKDKGNYDYLLLFIKTDRQILYQNINDRVDKMLQGGLIEEVKSLGLTKEYGSMNAIGYKEVLDFLNDGEKSEDLNKLSETIKLNTRRYAKRQITYFKNIFKDSCWLTCDDFEYAKKLITQFLNE